MDEYEVEWKSFTKLSREVRAARQAGELLQKQQGGFSSHPFNSLLVGRRLHGPTSPTTKLTLIMSIEEEENKKEMMPHMKYLATEHPLLNDGTMTTLSSLFGPKSIS